MKTFPILLGHKQRQAHPNWPRTVPWELVEPHERQAQRNHQQSLTVLAARGGLSPVELMWVIEDKNAWEHDEDWPEQERLAALLMEKLICP